MTEEKPVEEPVQEQSEEQSGISAAEEKPLEQPHFDPDAEKKPTEKPSEEKPIETKAPEEKTEEKSAEQKKAEANPEYMGNEMGEDILSIPLDDPVANAAASKIQVCHKAFFFIFDCQFSETFPRCQRKRFQRPNSCKSSNECNAITQKVCQGRFQQFITTLFSGFRDQRID